MDFTKLPIHLIESVLSRCDFETIAKTNRTCATVNKIIRKKKFDKLDVDKFIFAKKKVEMNGTSEEQFELYLKDRNKISLKLDPGIWKYYTLEYGTPWLEIDEETSKQSKNDAVNERISEIISSIRSLNSLNLGGIYVDETLVNMIESMPVEWNKATALFIDCSYGDKSVLIRISKLFKSVLLNEIDAEFLKNDAQSFDDDFVKQTLSNLVFLSDNLFEAPNITDKTLENYVTERPKTLYMDNFIVDFTVDRIMDFFRHMMLVRDSSIDHWRIGTVRLSVVDYIRLYEELKNLDNLTDDFKVFGTQLKDNRVLFGIVYENKDSNRCNSSYPTGNSAYGTSLSGARSRIGIIVCNHIKLSNLIKINIFLS